MWDDLYSHSYLEDLRTIASRLDSISEDDKKAMQEASMFLACRQRVVSSELLPAHQVIIGDWESRDFGGDVLLAPKDDIIESGCASSGVRHQLTHLCHRNVP